MFVIADIKFVYRIFSNKRPSHPSNKRPLLSPVTREYKVMLHGCNTVQHSVAKLEQCCNNSKQRRNNVATLCCAKNRRVRIVSCNITYKQRRERRQRERQKSNRLRLAKQRLCTCIMLFCTFLCSHCTTTT